MFHTVKKAIVLLFVLLPSVSLAGGLTEQTIQQMLGKMDKAIQEKDAQGVVDLMSPDVSITMNISMGGRQQSVRINRDQYLQSLKEGWAAYEDYKYQRSNLKIEIAEGSKKAVVKADILESMAIDGQVVQATTREESMVELINGKPLFTKLVGYTSM